jgi:acetyl-CoA carboxylase carboxyltransferase component
VVDKGSFFEMGKHFGRAIITGFARLDGWPVAILAGDPLYGGGAWGAAASRKITRFVDLAQTFHLPMVHLVDCFGFAVGLEAESTATMRHAVTAISAIHQSTIPWCAIIIRNVFGVGGGAHVPHTSTPIRYAWPSGNWGSLPLEGGVEAAYRAEIAAADDPEAKLEEISERLERMRSPFRSAEAFIIEEIIDPRDTRPLLCEFANMAAPLRTPGQSMFTMRP